MSSTKGAAEEPDVPALLEFLDGGGTIDEWQKRYPKGSMNRVVTVSAQRLAKLRPDANGALLVQLQELNVRSRVYMAQAWQVPFAYVAAVAVLAGAFLDKGVQPVVAATGFLVAAISGAVVWKHQRGVMDGSRRAVYNIQVVELALDLGRTAEWCGPAVFGWITWLIAIVAVLSAIAGVIAGMVAVRSLLP